MFANIQSREGAGLCSMISGALPGEHQDAGGAQATEQGSGLNCLLLGCEHWMALALIWAHQRAHLPESFPWGPDFLHGSFLRECPATPAFMGMEVMEGPMQCRQTHVILQSCSVLVEQMSIPETKVVCSPELKQIVSLDSCPHLPQPQRWPTWRDGYQPPDILLPTMHLIFLAAPNNSQPQAPKENSRPLPPSFVGPLTIPACKQMAGSLVSSTREQPIPQSLNPTCSYPCPCLTSPSRGSQGVSDSGPSVGGLMSLTVRSTCRIEISLRSFLENPSQYLFKQNCQI